MSGFDEEAKKAITDSMSSCEGDPVRAARAGRDAVLKLVEDAPAECPWQFGDYNKAAQHIEDATGIRPPIIGCP